MIEKQVNWNVNSNELGFKTKQNKKKNNNELLPYG